MSVAFALDTFEVLFFSHELNVLKHAEVYCEDRKKKLEHLRWILHSAVFLMQLAFVINAFELCQHFPSPLCLSLSLLERGGDIFFGKKNHC